MRTIRKFPVLMLFMMSVVMPLNAQKYNNGLVDKTVALIGNEAILLSQIESEMQMSQFQGISLDRCQLLENMLVQKLFLTQARLDSLPVSYDMIEQELNNRLTNAMASIGGEKATEEYFNKPIYKLKEEWRTSIEESQLTQDMQRKIAQKVTALTPEDVRRFYKRTSKDSLPIISTQYKLRQIALYPSKDEAVKAVKETLLSFRSRILNGEKFSTLATLYSEDPGSAIRGGELRMSPKQNYWPAFSDAAMSLKPGQVSQIVETPDGFHLIQMIEKEGDMFNARHILVKPKYSEADRVKAFKTLDSLKTAITADSISFEMAARIYSQDPSTRVNGGLMADKNTGAALFEKDQLKPEDYKAIENLKPGEISEPFESRDDEGNVGNTVYKIIQVEKIIPSHPATIENDYNVLLDVATQRASMDAIEKFIKEKINSTYIKIDPLFQKCNFQREGWVK